MSNKVRKILLLAVIVLIVVLVSGCQKSNEEPDAEAIRQEVHERIQNITEKNPYFNRNQN